MLPKPTAWADVRCQSPDCDRAAIGGRLLFRRSGDLCVRVSRKGGIIALTPLGAICECGAIWTDPRLGPIGGLIDAIGREALVR